MRRGAAGSRSLHRKPVNPPSDDAAARMVPVFDRFLPMVEMTVGWGWLSAGDQVLSSRPEGESYRRTILDASRPSRKQTAALGAGQSGRAGGGGAEGCGARP